MGKSSDNSKKALTDIVKEIAYQPEKRLEHFRSLSSDQKSSTFEHLSPYVQQDILEKLKTDELVELLDHFDFHGAEKMLARIKDSKKRDRISKLLRSELKEKAEYFLRFHPKASLNLLSFNYLLLADDKTVGDVADAMEAHYRETDHMPEVLVHKEGRCVGEVHPGKLIRENIRTPLAKLISPVKKVFYQDQVHEIIDIFKKSRHNKVVVLDTDDSIVGIIYADDVLQLISKEKTSALYNLAGVSESEHTSDGVLEKVHHRYKWLIINLGTAFLAAGVVGLFENTLSQLVILAVYMPIVAGMGGNAATQTLAVTVRGITVGEISLKNGMPAIRREVGAGLINGFITGSIVAIVATFWNGNPLLGFVIGMALVINLVIAGFFGALIPLVMKSLGKDPATSATIFITTATDVFGFFAFLGMATLILL
ncbi:MAG: magnesium transporter [Candidatus Colwellbacteria bacterium CG10_big_fil_rev_8_21_14_0_10_42_22]|uniref:Magnesium transporter n=1 Tax=Candidatus Colwellbacteria bacterium CG10_big_fil_rev_8_21_14_0_10_42_22 TaxID=1974540 RepID=A0A2H0VGP9_9BACT|nr:MAG: magnesium transporter [Candidatus Colwellbacteria bacterium CG10_big_fil_rev_8_21_14_0_10_42_22]